MVQLTRRRLLALGGDLAWGEATVAAGLRLHAHVPYPQQPERWATAQRARWRALVNQADATTVYDDLDQADGPRSRLATRLLHARNDGMLDRAVVLVAIWTPQRPRGGTWSAVRKAHKRGLPIVWLDPQEQRTCMPRAERVGELLELAPVPSHAR